MTVYVDPLLDHGWVLQGRMVRSCHMFVDTIELDALHDMALWIGCRRGWFQDKNVPHYDLTASRRVDAIAHGAVAITRRQAVEIWRERHEAVRRASPHRVRTQASSVQKER